MSEVAFLSDIDAAKKLVQARDSIKKEIARVIVGQERIIDGLLVGLLCRGHCLIVGVPGLAKTLIIRTLSQALDLTFSRIQFTPDLMPSDITGTEIIEEDVATGHRQFRFVRGPVFANIILADEINRTPPKTQSALLQAMQEHEVTVQGETMPLPDPFFVLATQNPIEQEGTYPLPEAQLDRFMFNLWIDYPSDEEEETIVKMTTAGQMSSINRILNASEAIFLQDLILKVPVSDHVVSRAVSLVRKTRPQEKSAPEFIREWVRWGAGPRASQYLILGAKARALLDGRYTPDENDVRAVTQEVLRHRIITNFNAAAEGVSTVDIVERLVEEVFS